MGWGAAMMRRPPKFVQGFIDRNGHARFYFRRTGFKRVVLPGLPWSPAFMEAYEAAMAGQPLSPIIVDDLALPNPLGTFAEVLKPVEPTGPVTPGTLSYFLCIAEECCPGSHVRRLLDPRGRLVGTGEAGQPFQHCLRSERPSRHRSADNQR